MPVASPQEKLSAAEILDLWPWVDDYLAGCSRQMLGRYTEFLETVHAHFPRPPSTELEVIEGRWRQLAELGRGPIEARTALLLRPSDLWDVEREPGVFGG